jgi:hypothetical protein
MPAYLIVANQSLGSRAPESATFHVVVPASPIPHKVTWDEDEAREAALDRLQGILGRLPVMGADADGEIGSPDPVVRGDRRPPDPDGRRGHPVDAAGRHLALARARRPTPSAGRRPLSGRGRDRGARAVERLSGRGVALRYTPGS